MQPVHAFSYPSPVSPADELHCMMWLVNTSNVLHKNKESNCDDNKNKADQTNNNVVESNHVLYVLLLGNESGQILYYAFKANQVSGKIHPCKIIKNNNNNNNNSQRHNNTDTMTPQKVLLQYPSNVA